MMDDNELTALLTREPAPPDPELQRLSVVLAREITRTDDTPARRPRSRRRAAIGLAAAALVFTPAAAFAAAHYLAQTGQFGHTETSEEDSSEWIDVCAHDLPAYMRSLPTPTQPPPPGTTWPVISDGVAARIQAQARQNCNGAGEIHQATGLRSLVLWEGQARWLDQAHAQHVAGHEKQARAAANRFADLLETQDALGTQGDEQWKPVRDAARVGRWPVIDEFWRANSTQAEPQPTPASGATR